MNIHCKKKKGITLTGIVSPASEVPTFDVSVLLMTGNLKNKGEEAERVADPELNGQMRFLACAFTSL
jgi:hypothetical protein